MTPEIMRLLGPEAAADMAIDDLYGTADDIDEQVELWGIEHESIHASSD